MKTQEILSIIALSLLGLCVLSGLVKMAMKKESHKKPYQQGCTASVFIAVVLLGISQLLTETEKLSHQRFDCVETRYGPNNTHIKACLPKPGGYYSDKETCQKNCIPYIDSGKLGKRCTSNTDCKAGDKISYDLTCNSSTKRCEFKACADLCAKNSPGSQDPSHCQQDTAGGPCTNAQNYGNNCTDTVWKGAHSAAVATGDNPNMFPAYIIDSYGSCTMTSGTGPSVCSQGKKQGMCYDKRITS